MTEVTKDIFSENRQPELESQLPNVLDVEL